VSLARPSLSPSLSLPLSLPLSPSLPLSLSACGSGYGSQDVEHHACHHAPAMMILKNAETISKTPIKCFLLLQELPRSWCHCTTIELWLKTHV